MVISLISKSVATAPNIYFVADVAEFPYPLSVNVSTVATLPDE